MALVSEDGRPNPKLGEVTLRCRGRRNSSPSEGAVAHLAWSCTTARPQRACCTSETGGGSGRGERRIPRAREGSEFTTEVLYWISPFRSLRARRRRPNPRRLAGRLAPITQMRAVSRGEGGNRAQSAKRWGLRGAKDGGRGNGPVCRTFHPLHDARALPPPRARFPVSAWYRRSRWARELTREGVPRNGGTSEPSIRELRAGRAILLRVVPPARGGGARSRCTPSAAHHHHGIVPKGARARGVRAGAQRGDKVAARARNARGGQ
jgi:hypothetical protein